ncbi:TetR family transcriptional regulator [Sinobacterium caligoides]|uniref:TetR family transcriptional regulator n=1 Tax=Sinobacterium caligoides TaxID=933926 RepID=A0A3N2DDT3_9GAMM|nr:TetR/AcrR family transcriptional regulator [Sinobacterium caligoides]ROR97960.1 TetR family transcriptional regulator [Sinobacterium caligoides]
MTSRRARRQQEVRQRIVQATLALFAERELDDISIQQLCERADIARRTFYAYFPCKEAVLCAVVAEQAQLTLRREYSEAEQQYPRFRQRLQHVVDSAIARREGYGEFERRTYKVATAYEFSLHGPDSRSNAFREYKRYFQRWISAGQQSGELTRHYSSELLAVACTGVLFNINQHWVNNADYPHLQRYRQAEAFLYDLLTD